jgi:ATP-binding cassette subfamily B protein
MLDAGRIVEVGPHARLVAAGGAYAALWASYVGEAAGHDRATAGA